MAMCLNHDCPSASVCYRHEAKPDERQCYANFDEGAEDECNYFIELEEKK